MASDDQANGSGPTDSHKGGYFEELHVALVVALVVICVALGVVGWKLHPDSNGFDPVPQNVRILVAGSGFGATQTLRQSGDEGATLKVTALYAKGEVPLVDAAEYPLESGPQAAGPVSVMTGPVVMFDGKPLPASRWGFIVLNPGSARPCGARFGIPIRYGPLSDAKAHARPGRASPADARIDWHHREPTRIVRPLGHQFPLQPQRALPQRALPAATRDLERDSLHPDPAGGGSGDGDGHTDPFPREWEQHRQLRHPN